MPQITGSRDKRTINNGILDLIKYRVSPFQFQNRAVVKEDFETIFEAGRWAPSAKNIQPWRFIYAEKGSTSYNKLYSTLTDKNKRWADSAPILMLCIYEKEDSEGQENFYALHDLGYCVSFMNIQAQQLGVAMHLMGGKDIQKNIAYFNLPKSMHVATIVGLGYYCIENEELSDDYKKEFDNSHKRKLLNSIFFKETIS